MYVQYALSFSFDFLYSNAWEKYVAVQPLNGPLAANFVSWAGSVQVVFGAFSL